MWECKIEPPVITFNIDMLQAQKTVFIRLLTKISMILLPKRYIAKTAEIYRKVIAVSKKVSYT